MSIKCVDGLHCFDVILVVNYCLKFVVLKFVRCMYVCVLVYVCVSVSVCCFVSGLFRPLISYIVHKLCHLSYQWWSGTRMIIRWWSNWIIARCCRWTTRMQRWRSSCWISFATIIGHFVHATLMEIHATVFTFQALTHQTKQHFPTIITKCWRFVRMHSKCVWSYRWYVLMIICVNNCYLTKERKTQKRRE